MRLLIIGNKGCGKTTAGDLLAWLPPNQQLKSISTSDILIAKYAEHASIPISSIISNKDQYRERLWRYGRVLQEKEPLVLVRQALTNAVTYGLDKPIDLSEFVNRWESGGCFVVTGVRNPDEMIAIRDEKLFDLIIWIAKDGCENSETDKLGPQFADVTVTNNSTLEELHGRLIGVLGQHSKSTF